MEFKMHCPKCLGFDYSIERDNRTFGAVAQAFELIFHCRCGKQMFGEQLLKEYDRQEKEFKSGRSDSDYAPNSASNSPAADLARLGKANVQTVSETAAVVADAMHKTDARDPSVVGDQMCTWPGCDKPARPNSKYCSRACSNKNARARHKARQKKVKKPAKHAAA
ncbi:MAG: hypothetical protein AAF602_12490 [Myxococcota bacterium]